MSVSTRRVLAISMLLGAFLAGFVCCLAAGHLGWLPPPPMPGRGAPHDLERAVSHFRSELDLDDTQTAEVRAALGEARDKTRALMNEGRPVVVAAVAEARRRIRVSLRPDQQGAFDVLVARMPVEGPPPPGSPGPDGPPPPQ